MASTEAQIRANRANAQLSTGPITPEGKARVASNRRTHGLAVSRHVILPGESASDYEALLAGFLADLSPSSTLEAVLVHQAAEAHWKLRRLARYEAELLALYPNPFLIEDEKIARKFTQLARYESAARRSFHLALEELRRFRAAQARELAQSLDAAIDTSDTGSGAVARSNPIPPQPPPDQTVIAPAPAPAPRTPPPTEES